MALQNALEEQYNVKLSGDWWHDELVTMQDAFTAIIVAFQTAGLDSETSTSAFIDIISGYKLNRLREHSGSRAIARITARIDFYNGTFENTVLRGEQTIFVARSDNEVFTTVAHEVGHIWDRREGYALSEGLKSEVGGRGEFCLWSACIGNYTVDDQTPYITVQYPLENPKNSREDLASTFAAFVVAPQALSALNSVDLRSPYISGAIQELSD